jgi:hypothetical protein
MPIRIHLMDEMKIDPEIKFLEERAEEKYKYKWKWLERFVRIADEMAQANRYPE